MTMVNALVRELGFIALAQAAEPKGGRACTVKASNIDTRISVLSDEASSGDLDFEGTDEVPGKASAIIKLISLLTIRAKGTDRNDAKNWCNQVIANADIGDRSYFKGMAKILLANINLNDMNDGKMPTSSANIEEALKLIAEGRGIIMDPAKGKAKMIRIDYYSLALSTIFELKLRQIRKGAGDSDDALTAEYIKLGKLIPDYKKKAVAAPGQDIDLTRDGLDVLAELINLQVAALYEDNQLSDDPTQRAADLKAFEGAITIATDAVAALEKYDAHICAAHGPYYKDEGSILPKDSFDYYSGRTTLANLLMKKAQLTGVEDTLVEALRLYKENTGKIFDVGLYKSYVSAWNKDGILNLGISFDQLEDVGITGGKHPNKNAAIGNALAFIGKVLDEKNPMIPVGKFLYCKFMLDRANLMLMRMRPGDCGAVKSSMAAVIKYADKINDEESRNDLKARANLFTAMATLYDESVDRTEPKTALTVIEEARRSLKDANTAVTELVRISKGKKKMDPPFMVDLKRFDMTLDRMAFLANKELKERAETTARLIRSRIDPAKPDPALTASATTFEASATTYDGTATTFADSSWKKGIEANTLARADNNKSKYYKEVVPNIIIDDLKNITMNKIDIRPTSPDAFLNNPDSVMNRFAQIDTTPGIPAAVAVTGKQQTYVATMHALNMIDRKVMQIFAINNQPSDTLVAADKMKRIIKLYGEIEKLITDNAAGISALTEGEQKLLYTNFVSASMIRLSFANQEAEREPLIKSIKEYAFKAIGRTDRADLNKNPLTVPYNIGDALLVVGLNTEDDELVKAMDTHCFAKLIAKNEVLKTDSAEVKAMKEDILAKCYAHSADVINWTTRVRNGEMLTAEEIAAFKKAVGLYLKAIALGLSKTDLRVLVNMQEALFKLAAGTVVTKMKAGAKGDITINKVAYTFALGKAITPEELVGRAEMFVYIAGKLNGIIAMAEDDGTLKDAETRDTHSRMLTNMGVILKAKAWKITLISSSAAIAKIKTQNNNVAAITGVDVSSYDLNTYQGIKDMQTALFNEALARANGLQTQLEGMQRNFGLSDRAMGDYGINTLRLNLEKHKADASVAVITNNPDMVTKVRANLESDITATELVNKPLEMDARITLGELIGWTGLRDVANYNRAIAVLAPVEAYYKKVRTWEPDDFKKVPIRVHIAKAESMAMKVYLSMESDTTTFAIRSYDTTTYAAVVSLLEKIKKYSPDKREVSWKTAMRYLADMKLLTAQTNAGQIGEAVNATVAVLVNENVPKPAVKKVPGSSAYAANIAPYSLLAAAYCDAILDPAKANAYMRNEFIVSSLSQLATSQARLLTLISSTDLQADKTYYRGVLQAGIDNISRVRDKLQALNGDANGKFYNRFSAENGGELAQLERLLYILQSSISTYCQ